MSLGESRDCVGEENIEWEQRGYCSKVHTI